MFGIGLPELILILALALIVVGPDKLPDLARSVAKGVLDLKKTANSLKESLTEEGNLLDDIKPDLEEAARALKDDVLGDDDEGWTRGEREEVQEPADAEDDPSTVIDVTAEQSAPDSDDEDAVTAESPKKPDTPEQQG